MVSIFKKSTTQQDQIDVSTTFNLWSILVSRYRSIETAQTMRNFVHDKDLEIALDLLLKHFQTQTAILEKETKNFKTKAPVRPASDLKTSARIDEFTDKYIYTTMHSDMIAELLSLSHAVRTTLTNDRLRKMFSEFLLSHLDDFEKLYKYGKLKGWEEIPPAYKTAKQGEKESLSVGEAYHIWHHINDRNMQSELSQLFHGFAHDGDFKLVLQAGVKTLAEQIKTIEKIALKHEILLPERPPASLKVPIDPESLEDQFMYAIVYKGIDDSIDMHIRAVLETLRNDSVREVFLKFFRVELEKQDHFLKFGKLKGWAKVPPVYVEPT